HRPSRRQPLPPCSWRRAALRSRPLPGSDRPPAAARLRGSARDRARCRPSGRRGGWPGAGCGQRPSRPAATAAKRYWYSCDGSGLADQGVQRAAQAGFQGAVDAYRFGMHAQVATAQAGIRHQALLRRQGQQRGEGGDVIGVQAHFHLAVAAADGVNRLADQLSQQRRIGLVGTAYQRTGDAYRQFAEGADHFIFQACQRPAEVVEDALDLRDQAAHFGLALAEAIGMALVETFLLGAVLDRLDFLQGRQLQRRLGLMLRVRLGEFEGLVLVQHRFGLGQQVRGKPAHDVAHSIASALPPMVTVPSSAMRLTMARISPCATSTSDRRTGPRASMSSSRISAARWDMLRVILSRTLMSAPRRARPSRSPLTSRSTSCISRSSRSTRSSNTNIRSWMRPLSGASMRAISPRIAWSWPLSMKLRMLAAHCTPPMLDDFRFWLPANWRSMISLSSFSALGGMPSRVAMRSSTSTRVRSGSSFSASAAWSVSRCAITMAMICGCSLRTRSATARGSIHFSASRPVVLRPSRMRSIRLPAF